MVPFPEDLRAALELRLGSFREHDLAVSVQRLIGAYRTADGVAKPVLGTPIDVAAYAAYRMPATFAAVAAAMMAMAKAVPEFSPQNLVDVGGGTGAASWAAAAAWTSLQSIKVVERQLDVIALGKALMAEAGNSCLRDAVWSPADVLNVTSHASDLATVSFLLGELPPRSREAFLARWADVAGALVIVEPGTPEGYARVIAARRQLLAAGFTIVAPCPHQGACPITPGDDWCHFSARVSRSAQHRRLKGGTLGHEDEKFSYLAAIRGTVRSTLGARVLRHPQKRKGMVTMRLCQNAGTIADIVVSQRDPNVYRAARDTNWGNDWAGET